MVHHDRVLNVALKRARSLRLITGNPVEDVSRPKVAHREIEILEPAEAAVLLAAARGTHMFTIIFLALATGLRRGEILGLRWSDVDLARHTLTVAQSLEQTATGGLRFKGRRRSAADGPSPSHRRWWRSYKRTARSRRPIGLRLAWGAMLPAWFSRGSTVTRSDRTA